MNKYFKKFFSIVFLVLLLSSSVACGEKEHNYKTTYVAPTCTDNGYLLHVCDCGETYTSDYIDKLGHRFENYVYNDDATCEENGTETAQCSNKNCDEINVREKQNSSLGHKFTVYVSDGNASCEADGTKTAVCDRVGCKETHTTTEFYSAHGHSFLNYVSNNDATREKDGTKTAKCEYESCIETHTTIDVGSRIKSKYSVSFLDDNGQELALYTITEGDTVSLPKDPEKENYIFTGWYTSNALIEKFDFSKPITKNTQIYAGFTLDAVLLTNKVATNAMKGIFKVFSVNYTENALGEIENGVSAVGSGFCFYISKDYFLVLTNCHVVKKDETFEKQNIFVNDCYGNRYNAQIINSAISPDYDLACLFVSCDTADLNVTTIPLASENISIGQDVIALGSPKGQINTLTYGKSYSYGKVILTDSTPSQSNVTFDVLKHNAIVNSGSSGGPILNSKLEVVGVHYAGNRTTGNGYAIPIQKVKEFLTYYNLPF